MLVSQENFNCLLSIRTWETEHKACFSKNFNCLLSIKTWEIGKANLRETVYQTHVL